MVNCLHRNCSIMEPDDFVGCIISIRTQPLPMNGPSKNIVGTIRSIDPKRQSITLDDVQVNGKMVEDGYVLKYVTPVLMLLISNID